MAQMVDQYKVTFTNQNEQLGFKYFFNERDVLDFLAKRPNGALIIKLEQYDRETHTFKPIK